jgi:hypothetical protein
MWRAFNLKLEADFFNENFYSIGHQIFESNKQNVKDVFDKYSLQNGNLDGTKMQGDWFPQIEADVFLSHSHKDQKTAIKVAGYLSESFGLNVFIDSCVWGYSNDLLTGILNNSSNLDEIKHATSHVNMMLSTSLSKMMDRTECLFFLNSKNSVSAIAESVSKTTSPWVFYEMSLLNLLEKKPPKRNQLKRKIKTFSESSKNEYSFVIEHEINLNSLIEISFDNLKEWALLYQLHSLNYELKLPIDPQSEVTQEKIYSLDIIYGKYKPQ